MYINNVENTKNINIFSYETTKHFSKKRTKINFKIINEIF